MAGSALTLADIRHGVASAPAFFGFIPFRLEPFTLGPAEAASVTEMARSLLREERDAQDIRLAGGRRALACEQSTASGTGTPARRRRQPGQSARIRRPTVAGPA